MFFCLKDIYNIINKIIGIGYVWKCKDGSFRIFNFYDWVRKENYIKCLIVYENLRIMF